MPHINWLQMKTKPTRIIFRYQGKLFKFMNYFSDKKDNSFYFHIYEESTEKLKIPNIPLHERKDRMIDFEDFVDTDFKRNKLSFHQSGFIHSTDENGKRFKDGVVGKPFTSIEKSLLILALGPKKIDTLIEIETTNLKTDILIELISDIKPFTVNFEVYRKTKMSELDISIPNLISGGFLLTEYDSKEFGLRLYLQRVLGDAIWPKFNLVLTKIG